MFLRRSPHKSTVSDRYNPIISRSMPPRPHLPPHETCPHRPHTPPPPSISPYNFPPGRPKSLPFPPIVLNRWDLPCRRNAGRNLRRAISTAPYLAIGCSDQRSPGADGDGKGRTYWDDKWQAGIVPRKGPKRAKKRGATRDFP